jgi:hypothetical protein
VDGFEVWDGVGGVDTSGRPRPTSSEMGLEVRFESDKLGFVLRNMVVVLFVSKFWVTLIHICNNLSIGKHSNFRIWRITTYVTTVCISLALKAPVANKKPGWCPLTHSYNAKTLLCMHYPTF